MKKTFTRMPVFLLLVLFAVPSCKIIKDSGNYQPIRWTDAGKGKGISYRENQILVFYKDKPTAASVQQIKEDIRTNGVTVTNIQQCSSCDSYIELWEGDKIHTIIHGEGVKAGSGGGGSRGVGEDSLARYSLNFINRLPVDITPGLRDSINAYNKPDVKPVTSGAGKDTILIAVLDTGVDTANFVHSSYMWVNKHENPTGGDADHNCYAGDINGWNFVHNNKDYRDDHSSLHGTLISRYIIDEFTAASPNFVQIMGLKTHDRQGYGDLFTSICAIHYAAQQGAQIINASWGFYYYDERPHPYLDSLITQIIRQKGILFITAAGNKIEEEDNLARSIYRDRHGVTLPDRALRNLDIHNFYPACFSRANNNVLVVTTTNGLIISPTQNFSGSFVDLGMKADLVTPAYMKFSEPFTRIPQYISGSSFATAIASGKLGAWMPKAMYVPGIEKEVLFKKLTDLIAAGHVPDILFSSTLLRSTNMVREGKYSKRR